MKRGGRDREREGRRKEEREGGEQVQSTVYNLFLGTLLLREQRSRFCLNFFYLEIYFSIPNQCIN